MISKMIIQKIGLARSRFSLYSAKLKLKLINYFYLTKHEKLNNIVFFGSNHGRFTGDNSWHLYLWWRRKKSYTCFWITKDKKEYIRLNSEGFDVLLNSSLRYYYYLNVCRAAFFTHSFLDIFPNLYLIPPSIEIGYLTHDIAPKRTRHAIKNRPITRGDEERSYRESERVDYYISTSDFITSCRSKALNVPISKFHITGLPRNDILIDTRQTERDNKRKVLYAPTWRTRDRFTELFPFEDFDPMKLVKFLEENDITILVRCHKNDLRFKEVTDKIKNLTDLSPNIVDATHATSGDVNSILTDVDVLISDYSGIIHDFLLLDRPIIGVLYDYEAFEAEYGFFYDLKKMFPGTCVASQAQLFTAIIKGIEQSSIGCEKRDKLRGIIFEDMDGNSCERIFKMME